MIYAMATHPEAQNKGFASELLEYCNFYLQAGNIF
jgi:ribosomal protein S18 acetylase RimI-like enzyme